uniref:Uncharacterized protein n=1 Tax=Kalanchoe fedtschenkoi TaxID=63787 RepID=A0A7N0ZRS2_KALFE
MSSTISVLSPTFLRLLLHPYVLALHLRHRLRGRFVNSAVQPPASSGSISATRASSRSISATCVLNVAASIADLWIRRCSHPRPPTPAPSPPPARPPAPSPPL